MVNAFVDFMRLTAVKIHYLKFAVQTVEIFVIAVDKDGRKGLFIEPVQSVRFRIADTVGIPNRAEITADNHNIVLGHLALLGKSRRRKLLELTVAIACYKNHNIVTPNFFASLISCCL